MKLTLISVVSTFLCATGVAVVSRYTVSPCCPNNPGTEKRAERAAAHISRYGTIAEYKSKNRHSSAVKKTTTAKVTTVEVKKPVWIANPLYPSFTNALAQLTEELADIAKDGEVELTGGFALTLKDGKPFLLFPESYTNVAIGGVALGDVERGGSFGVSRKTIEGTDRQQMDGIGLANHRHLKEPEFYCTDVTYSVLPATRQVDSIRMHGDLNVGGNTSNAQAMMAEISDWMREDYGAVELDATTPSGMIGLKKFRIGEELSVEVKVNWKHRRTDEGCDANIDISFTSGELAAENRYQRQELGKATDTARLATLDKTGVNYFSVRPTVNADSVAKKVVY